MVEMMTEWVEMTTAIRGDGGGTTSSGTTTLSLLPMYMIMLEMVVGIYSLEMPSTTIR